MSIAGTGAGAGLAPPRPPRVLSQGWAHHAVSIESAASGWRGLQDEASEDNPFFDPGFLGPAAKALRPEVELLTVDDGRLLGMMPVITRRFAGLVPSLRVWTNDYAPLGTPVMRSKRLSEIAFSLIEPALERAGPTGILIMPMVVPTDAATGALESAAETLGRRVRFIDNHHRAALFRSAGETDPRSLLPKRRRKEYARQMRRFAEERGASFEHAVSPVDVLARFEDFIALEAAGWKGRRGTALARNDTHAAFARAAFANLARHGNASVLTLRAGDRPAAILVCLHQNRTAFTWKIAFDETLAKYSPGAQLMLEAPRFLFANDRIERIDSCAAPDHPMIDHLWSGRLPIATMLIGPERMRWRLPLGVGVHHAQSSLRAFLRRTWRAARPQTR